MSKRFIVFEVPDELLDRVALVPTDPRDGPADIYRVADGTALQAVLGLLTRCDSVDLHDLRVDLLAKVERRVLAEERAWKAVGLTHVVQVSEIQREFDRAVAEEMAAQAAVVRQERAALAAQGVPGVRSYEATTGTWNEEYGQSHADGEQD